MTPLEAAAAAVGEAQERFDQVWASSLAPGLLQLAGRNLAAAADHYADLRRETTTSRPVAQPA